MQWREPQDNNRQIAFVYIRYANRQNAIAVWAQLL